MNAGIWPRIVRDASIMLQTLPFLFGHRFVPHVTRRDSCTSLETKDPLVATVVTSSALAGLLA